MPVISVFGNPEAKPVGQTFREQEELGGYGEVPALGLFHTNMPVYAETGEKGKAQPDKRLASETYKVGVGLCANVSFKCCLHLYLILASLNVLL